MVPLNCTVFVLEALQDELIIPRPRPVESQSAVDELDSLPLQEIRRLAAQMLCKRMKDEKIKQTSQLGSAWLVLQFD